MSEVITLGLVVVFVLIGVAAAASVIMDASQPMGRHELGVSEYGLIGLDGKPVSAPRRMEQAAGGADPERSHSSPDRY